MHLKFLLLFLLLPAAIFAQTDTAAYLRPPYLRPGDTVGIISPAGRIPRDADTARVRERFAAWGLHVKFGVHSCDPTGPYFAASDEERAADLHEMLADSSVKAVIAYRGGYGSVRLLPRVDLSMLRRRPKWLVGFSDITLLHLALRRLRVESIHGPMPGSFRFDEEDRSAESLHDALTGRMAGVDLDAHPFNRPGTATGRLAGGNLTQLCMAAGTPEQLLAGEPTVLLIEEVGEFAYRIDRMMQHLVRSGLLAQVRAILVGHFSAIEGTEKLGVEHIYQVIDAYTRDLGIPVVFGFPSGHEDPNLALYMGRQTTVTVDDKGARVRF